MGLVNTDKVETKGPNILLVMSDQHNKHVTGCYGDSLVKTPNLDSLASRGAVFENAYCTFPLCAPSRMSFMTGRYPYELKTLENASVLSSDIPTFAHALGTANYETVLCGRMHFNGPDQRHGFQHRIFPEVSGQAAGELVDTTGLGRPSLEKSGPGRNHYLLYDQECVTEANKWLINHANSGNNQQPFCLVVGLVGPHCPFVCPREQFDKYYDAIEIPEYTSEYFGQMHPFNRRFRERSNIENLTKHEIRRTRAAYYGMVEFDDRLIGLLLNTLKETALAEDTVVIYTSDHGEMAGEHGMWWKMTFYEGSCGVPLIISWPGHFLESHRERIPVSLLHITPTLAEIAGAAQIPQMSGKSLVGLLRGQHMKIENEVFSEMYVTERKDQGPSGGPVRMMRKGNWKCNYYYEERPELFNLSEDPHEMVDRSRDPACKRTLDEMLFEILKDWNPEKVISDAKFLKKMRDYTRSSPGDTTVLEKEYWQGPKNYGHVEAV